VQKSVDINNGACYTVVVVSYDNRRRRMAIRKAPRKRLRLDSVYADQGGVQDFVLARLDAGERVEDIAKTLTDASGESVARRTLYHWINVWKGKNEEKEQEVAA
jgi:hypothetical protein